VFSFQPTDRVFSEALYVFPLAHDTAFAVLQSRVHEVWARRLSSSLENRLRYAATDCFRTFPFPHASPRARLPALEAAGARFYEARARVMSETDQGLTKIYNMLRDPDDARAAALELRALTEAMDRAVLRAYGWADILVPTYCPKNQDDHAAQRAFTDELIDRLFALNQRRAAAG
jgi:hypothetical protein